MRRSLLFTSILATAIGMGCGELLGLSGDDETPGGGGGTGDASTDVSTAEGGTATARCNPTAAFGAPVIVAELANPSIDESTIALSEDELTAYVGIGTTIEVAATRNIVLFGRASTTSPWEKRDDLPLLNTQVEDDNASPTGDGKTLYFHSTRRADAGASEPRRDIFIATRSSTSEAFADPILAPGRFNADGQRNIDPFILPDRTALFWSSDRDNGNFDLWMSTESLGGLGTNEQKLESLSSAAFETQPVVSADGLEIFFARADEESSTAYDVWHATRGDKIAPFGDPKKVDPVNTEGTADVPGWISADHCVLYLASSRGASGSRDIYVATRGK